MSSARVLVAVAALLTGGPAAHAHEVRPAYLEITETQPAHYAVLWRTPLTAGMRLPVTVQFPSGARDAHPPVVQELADSLLERRAIDADGGLAGKRVELVGLQATITDVLVRVELLDGRHSVTLVHPSNPWVDIAVARGLVAVMGAYVRHGIEHILYGFDHLLFVLALILIVRRRRVLLATITAFTAAHSITLALATLGIVHVPGPPVEAAIALSILLLAVEIVNLERGNVGFTARWPWVVAFSFGLLHGFGFASALSDLGLPQGDVPLALFSFNVGVEAGQLAFVATVLGLGAATRRLRVASHLRRHAVGVAPYAIGTLATFWLFDRLARF